LLDVSQLAKAEHTEVRMNGQVSMNIWHAEANDCHVSYQTLDLEAEYWVSPILTMREQGVALIDNSGQMVKNSRRLR
jgi:hypothetical protein